MDFYENQKEITKKDWIAAHLSRYDHEKFCLEEVAGGTTLSINDYPDYEHIDPSLIGVPKADTELITMPLENFSSRRCGYSSGTPMG